MSLEHVIRFPTHSAYSRRGRLGVGGGPEPGDEPSLARQGVPREGARTLGVMERGCLPLMRGGPGPGAGGRSWAGATSFSLMSYPPEDRETASEAWGPGPVTNALARAEAPVLSGGSSCLVGPGVSRSLPSPRARHPIPTGSPDSKLSIPTPALAPALPSEAPRRPCCCR